MALKVIPASDERCDIHNRRNPPQYVCESCLTEFGIDPERPTTTTGGRSLKRTTRRTRRGIRRAIARRDRRILIGGGIGVAIVVIVVVLAVSGGGGGGAESRTVTHPRTEKGVVSALGLIPSPGGTGWTTPDGACWVVSIQFGQDVHPGKLAGNQLIEATNDQQTVGAAVTQNDFSVSSQACASRIGAGLRAHY